MARLRTSIITAALAVMVILPSLATAGLFEDSEARRAVTEIRTKLDAKADTTSLLELSSQNEALKLEISKLRGQVEVLGNELANAQRRQKDFYVELDNRMRKLEPHQVVIDGKEVIINSAEQNAYDTAMTQYKAGDYKAASEAFADFVSRYPKSGFVASAQYFLGSSYYALRDYPNAISAQMVIVKLHSHSSRAPDAMLNIASCYTEMKDKPSAKKVLTKLIAQYPKSEAAETAKERLASQ
jgi:tol-pal system protein YbgF